MPVKVNCVHCGTPVKELEIDCPQCGKPVANKHASISTEQNPWARRTQVKKSNPMLFVGIAFLILSAVTTALYFIQYR
ncbi:MAG: hypothetical protein JW982_07205 [Spirochaetes bacterium]|nr:hypothetical protein [Spirochaetota bacterium]